MGQCLSVGVADWVASRPQRHDLVGAALDRRKQVVGPRGKRDLLFLLVGRTVVDPGNACLVAADVVQHGLDYVRLYPDFVARIGAAG
jgi:hypothetical protein